MFGKKKKEIIIQHYEGLEGFYQNCPCIFNETENSFEFKKAKESNVITLNKNQIKMIDCLSEKDFMMKYQNTTPLKTSNPKFYLIIKYISKQNQEKQIVFWGTVFESRFLMDLKYKFSNNSSSENIIL